MSSSPTQQIAEAQEWKTVFKPVHLIAEKSSNRNSKLSLVLSSEWRVKTVVLQFMPRYVVLTIRLPPALLPLPKAQLIMSVEEKKMRIKKKEEENLSLVGLTPSTSVESVKFEIQAHRGIPVEEQRLFFGWNEPLENDKTLADYKINSLSELYMIPSYPPNPAKTATLQFCVRELSGRTITVDMMGNDTIDLLKFIVAAKTGIPACEQRLIFSGKQLLDDDKLDLAFYGIADNSIIHLVRRC